MTNAATQQTRSPATETPYAAPGAVMVAFDCTGPTLRAMDAARKLAVVMRRPVRIVSVTESATQDPATQDLVSWPTIGASGADGTFRPSISHFPSFSGESAWNLEVGIGSPGRAIARAAEDADAALIVAGMVHDDPGQSLVRGETLIDVAEHCKTPLLATSSLNWNPHRVLVAVDSEIPGLDGSLPPELFASVSSVYCVHVSARSSKWGLRNAGQQQEFDPEKEIPGRLRSLLRLSDRTLVQGVKLQGDPVREILDFAKRFNIDLIVIGRRARSAWQRMLENGVSARLLRRARCSVLMVPGSATRCNGSTVSYRDPRSWSKVLAELAERTIGRRVDVEVIDEVNGAQTEIKFLPLQGIAYDHRDERVELMVGGFAGSSRHLTHSVGGVTSIDLLHDGNGNDRAVRISYDSGQVIVTFV